VIYLNRTFSTLLVNQASLIHLRQHGQYYATLISSQRDNSRERQAKNLFDTIVQRATYLTGAEAAAACTVIMKDYKHGAGHTEITGFARGNHGGVLQPTGAPL